MIKYRLVWENGKENFDDEATAIRWYEAIPDMLAKRLTRCEYFTDLGWLVGEPEIEEVLISNCEGDE